MLGIVGTMVVVVVVDGVVAVVVVVVIVVVVVLVVLVLLVLVAGLVIPCVVSEAVESAGSGLFWPRLVSGITLSSSASPSWLGVGLVAAMREARGVTTNGQVGGCVDCVADVVWPPWTWCLLRRACSSVCASTVR